MGKVIIDSNEIQRMGEMREMIGRAERRVAETNTKRIPISAEFFIGSKDAIRVNTALREMNDWEKLVFCRSFFNLRKCDRGTIILSNFFGEELAKKAIKPMVATLTADGRELRFWHDGWGHVSEEHIDSSGSGLILDLGEHPLSLQIFVDLLVRPFVQFGIKELPLSQHVKKRLVASGLVFCLEKEWNPTE